MQKNKPKIIISTYDDIKNPSYGGGGAIAVHELAKRLASSYELRVLSWDYSGKKKEVIDGVCYERFGNKFFNPKIAMFIYQFLLPFQVVTKKYDLWLESFCPPFTTALLPLFTKRPVIGIVHMLASKDMERKYKLPFHIIENFGIRQYQQIILTSNVLENKIKKINPQIAITVISNGIRNVVAKVAKKEKYILFLGRIEVNQKGLDLLLSAFSRFLMGNSGYTLVIAGDGSANEISQLKRLIKNSEVTKNVKLVGKVAGQEKEKLLQNAACLVVSSRFETYSLVALEALAQGTPLICFNIKGLSWIPKTMVQKVTAFDTNELARTMKQVVSDAQLQKSMTTAGLNYARKFTWDAIAKQYDLYIKKIVK